MNIYLREYATLLTELIEMLAQAPITKTFSRLYFVKILSISLTNFATLLFVNLQAM